MNEVKTPKKPLIVYYAIAILVVLLINTLLVPMVSQARVKYVDYGTFIQMTEEDKISEVQVQDNQIVFITKEDEANKNAVYYRTGKMDDPELTSRVRTRREVRQGNCGGNVAAAVVPAFLRLPDCALYRAGAAAHAPADEAHGRRQGRDVLRHGQFQCQGICEGQRGQH